MIKINENIKSNLKYDHTKLRKLCEKFALKLVILHGSYATGHVHKESDIDIGILFSADKIKKFRSRLVHEFCELFTDKCDIVILNNVESMIVFQTVMKGIPLYEAKTGTFAEFQTTAISRYQDAAKFRRLEKRYLQLAIERKPGND